MQERKYAILVVDDVSANIQVVGAILRQEGYKVFPAQSAEQAIKQLQSKKIDLILSDLMMPEEDGVSLCNKIKANPETKDIPVLILTASSESDDMVRAFEAGAIDYITKPFRESEILARVRNHLDLKQSQDLLKQTNDKLNDLSREKNEFIGMASHELKSPLSSILGFIQMMLDDPEDIPTDVLVSDLNVMQKASEQMLHLIQNLLDVNSIEEGMIKFHKENFNPSPYIPSFQNKFKLALEEKEQTIEIDDQSDNGYIHADISIVEQIIENLISNAIKFSQRGKKITISLTNDDEFFRIAVRDEGLGIPEKDIGKLFTKFAKLSPRPTGNESSHGLGLSIVKRMVEAMDGSIFVKSEQGVGSVFTVRFPLVSRN